MKVVLRYKKEKISICTQNNIRNNFKKLFLKRESISFSGIYEEFKKSIFIKQGHIILCILKYITVLPCWRNCYNICPHYLTNESKRILLRNSLTSCFKL